MALNKEQSLVFMFENKLSEAAQLLAFAKQDVTWLSPDIDDVIEQLTSLIVDDLYEATSRVEKNLNEILKITESWSKERQDVMYELKNSSKEVQNLHDLIEQQKHLAENCTKQ